MHKHIFVNKFVSGTSKPLFSTDFFTPLATETPPVYLRHKAVFKMSDFIASAQELHVLLEKIL